MKNEKEEQSDEKLSATRSGKEFWEDLMKKPYNNDKVGQSFVRIIWKRLPETGKTEEDKK